MRISFLCHRSLLSTFLILGSFFVGASTVQAVDTGNYGGKPAHPGEGNDHTKQWFIYTSLPVGEKREDALLLSNDSDTPLTLKVYPADSAKSSDGGFALEQEVEERDEVGKWITLSTSEVTLEPHTTQEVPFSIEIPADATVDAGEHAGGILVQEKKEVPTTTTGGIQLSTRIGVRVYVTVPGDVVEDVQIKSFNLKTSENGLFTDKEAEIEVQNTGTVREDLTIVTKIEPVYSWLSKIFDRTGLLPISNERGMQVLRDDTLRSSFQFVSPKIAKVKATATVVYLDVNGEKQTISATPIEQWVLPPQKQLIIIGVVLLGALIAAVLIIWGVIRTIIRLRRALQLLKSQESATQQGSVEAVESEDDESEAVALAPVKKPRKKAVSKTPAKKATATKKPAAKTTRKKTTTS